MLTQGTWHFPRLMSQQRRGINYNKIYETKNSQVPVMFVRCHSWPDVMRYGSHTVFWSNWVELYIPIWAKLQINYKSFWFFHCTKRPFYHLGIEQVGPGNSSGGERILPSNAAKLPSSISRSIERMSRLARGKQISCTSGLNDLGSGSIWLLSIG